MQAENAEKNICFWNFWSSEFTQKLVQKFNTKFGFRAKKKLATTLARKKIYPVHSRGK